MRRSGGDKFYADNFDKQGTSLFGFQAVRDFPICNHTQCLSKYDVGYCQAILCDGMPFEAELYKSDRDGPGRYHAGYGEETAALYDDACVNSRIQCYWHEVNRPVAIIRILIWEWLIGRSLRRAYNHRYLNIL